MPMIPTSHRIPFARMKSCETATEIAEYVYHLFTHKQRDNGDDFVCLVDDAPEWCRELVREAHGTDMLPDDWRYDVVHAAFARIADMKGDEDASDVSFSFADEQVDVYNSARTEWLASNGLRPGIVDDAVAEMGSSSTDMMDLIALGQFHEARQIFDRLISALEEMTGEVLS